MAIPTTIHYKKERRPTALRREKREEHLDTEGHQEEGAGEKEEPDWEEAKIMARHFKKKTDYVSELATCDETRMDGETKKSILRRPQGLLNRPYMSVGDNLMRY
jgi:hypothetical protein